MKVVIVDDELHSIQLMQYLLGKYEQLEIVGAYSNSMEALKAIRDCMPDVLFLDIEMSQMNGIELAKEAIQLDESVQIVFVTAYSEYALEAFDVNAVHYLLKPVSELNVLKSVQRILKNHTERLSIETKNKVYRIEVFGEFTVYGQNELYIVKWPTQKVKELFSYFVCHKNMEIDKWQLCELLWPDSTRSKAEHNLHSTISRLKQSLKNVGIINILSCTKGKYKLDLSKFSCDLWEYESFILKNQIIDAKNVEQYEAMLTQMSAPIWNNADYVWILDIQEHWRKCYLNMLRQLIKYFTISCPPNSNKVEKFSKIFLTQDPFDEEIHRVLMNDYISSERFRDATQLYSNYENLLKDELNIEPSLEIKKQYQNIFQVNTIKK